MEACGLCVMIMFFTLLFHSKRWVGGIHSQGHTYMYLLILLPLVFSVSHTIWQFAPNFFCPPFLSDIHIKLSSELLPKERSWPRGADVLPFFGILFCCLDPQWFSNLTGNECNGPSGSLELHLMEIGEHPKRKSHFQETYLPFRRINWMNQHEMYFRAKCSNYTATAREKHPKLGCER